MKRIHPALALFLIAFFAYGLMLPSLGFYWDDLPMSWIRYQLGAEAMTRYFSTNRPVWAWLYQVTTHILPHVPIYWQVFALFWRWLGAVTLWAIARQLFPQREKFAFTLSLLFLIYPGFNQQWGSYLYSHFFIVLFFFLYSIYLTLRGRTIPALLFSALNLWMMEYFFFLELARPFVIFTTLRVDSSPLKARILKTVKLSIPYLVLFALAVLSRLFIFNNQVYQIGLNKEEASPAQTLLGLIQDVFASLWTTTAAAWAQVFQFPNPAVDGPRTMALYTFVLLAAGGAVWLAMRNQPAEDESRAVSAWAIGLGLVLLALAGPPFWLTGVPVSLGFPANRALLSFMFGACFLLLGLLDLLPPRLKYLAVLLLIALSAGRQFLWSMDYLRDWSQHKNLFWQMSWRAPNIEKGTLVLMNEELKYYADNSLSPVLNWIYSPDNRSDAWDYVLFYPTNRTALSLTPGAPVKYDFLAGEFHGNTSQALVFYYDPPRCLRLLDPEIDSVNRLIPDDSLLRDAALLSSSALILSRPAAQMPEIYYPEPAHGWCYYFQKADLARQMRDWETVAELGEIALALDDHPNDPVERFVFIEGYAHAGNWKKAVELSLASHKVSKKYVAPLLCKLWARIERETENTPQRQPAMEVVNGEFECPH